jgi:hypothetical protein
MHKMIRLIVIILFVLSSYASIADSIGHLFESHETTIIKIYDENGNNLSVDSICLVFPGSSEITQLNPPRKGPWRENRLDIKNEAYAVYDLRGDFMVVVFSNNQRYLTGIIEGKSCHRFYAFKAKNDWLIDISPFFHETWYIYFLSLFVTLVVEILIGFKFIGPGQTNIFVLTIISVNVFTHFSAWYIYSHSREHIPVFFLELIVIAVESFYWKFFLRSSFGKAVKISVLLNMASWIIGAIVTSI